MPPYEQSSYGPSACRPRFALDLVCPKCRHPLLCRDDTLVCNACHGSFEIRDGFPDLIVGQRFEDASDDASLAYEEESNIDTTLNYWVPLFSRYLPVRDAKPKIVSIGCGTGIDIDILNKHGAEAVGIDCGNRSKVWHRRQSKDCLVMANGQHLPFEDGVFDAAYCGCVFPHVGVVGDSYQVTPRYREDRLELAREMVRVLKPGGRIFVSSPNRYFPFDIFHGREAGSYRPRPYSPRDPFLLSIRDYRELFQQACRVRVKALPVAGYWGFIRSKKSWKGYLLGLPVRLFFRVSSWKMLRFLRGSPLSPWLVLMIEKA